MFPSDVYNTPVRKLPISDKIRNLGDFDMLISMSSGYPGAKEWIYLEQILWI